MDQEKFDELKQRAVAVFDALDKITGSGAIIHERNMLSIHIDIQLLLLETKGEYTVKDRYLTMRISLNDLEKYIENAEEWIKLHR